MAVGRRYGGIRLTTSPFNRISPESGSRKPPMRLRSVVFPQPDGPSSVTNSPRATLNETELRARVAPKALPSPRTSRTGPSPGGTSAVNGRTPDRLLRRGDLLREALDPGRSLLSHVLEVRDDELLDLLEPVDDPRRDVGLQLDLAVQGPDQDLPRQGRLHLFAQHVVDQKLRDPGMRRPLEHVEAQDIHRGALLGKDELHGRAGGGEVPRRGVVPDADPRLAALEMLAQDR